MDMSAEELKSTETTKPNSPFRRGRMVSLVIVVALFLIGTLQSLTGSRGSVTSQIYEQDLGVAGTYGTAVLIDLTTVTDVQLLETFEFGTCVDGDETGNTVSGTYSCADYGEYVVHAYKEKPCIAVHHPDGVLVFNCSSSKQTEEMYQELLQAADLTS